MHPISSRTLAAAGAPTSGAQDARAADLRASALLDRLRAREPAALGELYDLYGARVHAIAARIDRDSAEDVTHDVFLKLWQRGVRFDERSRLATWLYRLAMNAAIDHARRRRVRSAFQVGALAAAASSSPPLDDAAQRAERLDLAAAVAELPSRLRWPVVLRFYAGLDYGEIASALGCREGTVASRLSRALSRLGSRLGARAAGGDRR